MGNAGRVLMIPKGEYNSATTYEMLDFVYYQGRSYVCKQTSTGNVPTNTTYWQALTGDASAEIQALTNKLEDEAETRAALGAHNFLKTTITSQTKNGITLTVNSDKSITISTEAGGATETTVFNVCEGYSLKAGTYIYSGVPATGSSTTTYYLDMRTDTSSQFIIDSSRPEREITTAGQSGNDARLIIMSGVVITTPITFKPMIRLATDADPTYQPYAKTNVELTQDVTPVNAIASVTVPSGTMSGDSYLYKVGKIVIAYLQITGVTASANDFVCTIPEGYRPLKNINGACKKSGDDSLRLVPVLYTGNVQTPMALTNNTFTMSAMTWITA